MPAYATTTDLTRLGLPSDALVDVTSEAQEAALAAASALADSYLRSRYRLPLTAWSDELTRVVCVIAAWDLLTTRGFDPSGSADEAIRQRYEDAIGWLKDVSRSVVTPDVTDSSVAQRSAAPAVYSRTARGW